MKAVLWQAYLILSVAILFACAILAAIVVLSSPSHGYAVTITTNAYHEGTLEFWIVMLTLPGWAVLARRLTSDITRPGRT